MALISMVLGYVLTGLIQLSLGRISTAIVKPVSWGAELAFFCVWRMNRCTFLCPLLDKRSPLQIKLTSDYISFASTHYLHRHASPFTNLVKFELPVEGMGEWGALTFWGRSVGSPSQKLGHTTVCRVAGLNSVMEDWHSWRGVTLAECGCPSTCRIIGLGWR